MMENYSIETRKIFPFEHHSFSWTFEKSIKQYSGLKLQYPVN